MLYVEVKLEMAGSANNGKIAFLEMESSDNVTQVKEKVLAELELGLLADNYKLYFHDKALADDSFLIDNNVQDFDSLILKCLPTKGISNMRHVDTSTRSNTQTDSSNADGSNNTHFENTTATSGKLYGRRSVYEEDRSSHVSTAEPLLRIVKNVAQQMYSAGLLCCIQDGSKEDDIGSHRSHYYDDEDIDDIAYN